MADQDFYLSDMAAPEMGPLTIDDVTRDSPLAMEDEMVLADEAEHPLEMMGWMPDMAPGAIDAGMDPSMGMPQGQANIGTWPTPEVGMGPPQGSMAPGPGMPGAMGAGAVGEAPEQDEYQLKQDLAEALRMSAEKRQSEAEGAQANWRGPPMASPEFKSWK